MMKDSKKPTVQPKTKEELKSLIEAEIKKNGNQCDLNYIDVSLVSDFSWLFFDLEFNGDISRWDVSRAKNMGGMFWNSTTFNGDISGWDVSSVDNMRVMFEFSKFNSDISKWDVSSVENMAGIFANSQFNGNISNWNVSSVAKMSFMFNASEFEGDVSSWNRSSMTDEVDMFLSSVFAKKLGAENPNFEQVKSHFLNLKLEEGLKEASPGQSQVSKVRL